MSRNKRLFIVAAYDKDGIIDDALLHQVRTLALYGNVIVVMDNQSHKRELYKIRKYTSVALILRHHEYDFGSYKRGFIYARDKGMLDIPEYLYLVNDSVFGPLFSPKKIIKKMEHAKEDAVSMVVSTHETHAFMESWFVRLNRKIFTADWFEKFITSVTREPDKDTVTIKYEHGLTKLIQKHNCTWTGLFTVRGRKTYNNPKYLFDNGCPFVKKASFTRHNGALGGQIKKIFDKTDPITLRFIMKTAKRLYGERYMKRFLTSNPLRLGWRNFTYGIKKLTHGGI